MRKLLIADTECITDFWGIRAIEETGNEIIKIEIRNKEVLDTDALRKLVDESVFVFHNASYDSFIINQACSSLKPVTITQLMRWNNKYFDLQNEKGSIKEKRKRSNSYLNKGNRKYNNLKTVCSMVALVGQNSVVSLKYLQQKYGLPHVIETFDERKYDEKFGEYFDNDILTLRKLWLKLPELKGEFDSRGLALKLLNFDEETKWENLSEFENTILAVNEVIKNENTSLHSYRDVNAPEFKNHTEKNIPLTPSYLSRLTETERKTLTHTEVEYKQNEFIYSRGGIHSTHKYKNEFKNDNEYLISHLDYGSMYPNIILNNPEYFQQINLKLYSEILVKRFSFKSEGEIEKSDAFKLILNSTYGQLNNRYNKRLGSTGGALFVCLEGHNIMLRTLDILDSYLEYELIQTNTDGLFIKYLKSNADKLNAAIVATQDEIKIGFENELVTHIWQKDVNNYICEYENGKIKSKGSFAFEGILVDRDRKVPLTVRLLIAKQLGFNVDLKFHPYIITAGSYIFHHEETEGAFQYNNRGGISSVGGLKNYWVLPYNHLVHNIESMNLTIYEEMANEIIANNSKEPFPYLSEHTHQMYSKDELEKEVKKTSKGDPILLKNTLNSGFKSLTSWNLIKKSIDGNFIMGVGHFSRNSRDTKHLKYTNSMYLDLDLDGTPPIEESIKLLTDLGYPPVISYYTVSANLEKGGIKKQRHVLMFDYIFNSDDADLYVSFTKYLTKFFNDKLNLQNDPAVNNISRVMFPKSTKYPDVYYNDPIKSMIECQGTLLLLMKDVEIERKISKQNLIYLRSKTDSLKTIEIDVRKIIEDVVYPMPKDEGTYNKFIFVSFILKTLFLLIGDRSIFNPRAEFKKIIREYRGNRPGESAILNNFDKFDDVGSLSNRSSIKYINEKFLSNIPEVKETEKEAEIIENAANNEDFPIEIFPKYIQSFLKESHENDNFSINWMANAVLAVGSIVMGTRCEIIAKPGFIQPAMLYIANVGESGTTKTSSINRVLTPINLIRRKFDEDYLIAEGVYNQAVINAGEEDAIQNGIMRGVYKDIIINDATMEGLGKVLQNNEKGVLFDPGELGVYFKSKNEYKGGKGADSERYINIWDGKSLKTTRKVAEENRVTDPFVTIIGSSTFEGFIKGLENHLEDGLAYRFCPVYDNPPHWEFVPENVNKPSMEKHDEYVKNILNLYLNLNDFSKKDKLQIKYTPESQQLFKEFTQYYNQLAAGENKVENFNKIKAKLHIISVRISGILAILNHKEKIGNCILVPPNIIFDAYKVVKYIVINWEKFFNIKTLHIQSQEVVDKLKRLNNNQEKSIYLLSIGFTEKEVQKFLLVKTPKNALFDYMEQK